MAGFNRLYYSMFYILSHVLIYLLHEQGIECGGGDSLDDLLGK